MKRSYNRWTVPMLARTEALYVAGLSFPAIAAVLNLDYGATLTGQGVEQAVRRHLVVEPRKSKNDCLRMAA